MRWTIQFYVKIFAYPISKQNTKQRIRGSFGHSLRFMHIALVLRFRSESRITKIRKVELLYIYSIRNYI